MKIIDLKNILKEKIIEGYKLKTNFSSNEFLVEINDLVICAKPICYENEVKYEFVLDIQFRYSKEITYEELLMINDVIKILEEHRSLALSKLKKWTVDEFEKDRKMKEKRSNELFENLKSMISNQSRL